MTERLINSLRQKPSGLADMTLDGTVTNVQTTITVAASPGVPANLTAGNVRLRLDDEFMLVTGVAGLVLTVEREAEEPALFPKSAHSNLTAIYLVMTGEQIGNYVAENGGIGGRLYLAANFS